MVSRKDRDWRKYNEQLVMHGEILLDLNVLKGWRSELDAMNKNKQGHPFEFPDVMMLLYAMMRAAFHIPYRQLEGLARALGKLLDLPAPDYSTFSLRFPALDIDENLDLDTTQPIVLAIDSSGVKLTHQGQWRQHKHSRKQFVKLHVAIDVKTKKVVSADYTPGHHSDTRSFPTLVKEAKTKAKIERTLADSAYDDKKNYALLRRHGIRPGIRPKSNTSFFWNKPPQTARTAAVRKWIDDPDEWKEQTGYGKRALVESFFSSFKRQFGNQVQNHDWDNIIAELKLKVSLYNLWVGLSPEAANG